MREASNPIMNRERNTRGRGERVTMPTTLTESQMKRHRWIKRMGTRYDREHGKLPCLLWYTFYTCARVKRSMVERLVCNVRGCRDKGQCLSRRVRERQGLRVYSRVCTRLCPSLSSSSSSPLPPLSSDNRKVNRRTCTRLTNTNPIEQQARHKVIKTGRERERKRWSRASRLLYPVQFHNR